MYKLIILNLLFISALFSNPTKDKVSLQLLWKHQFEFAGFYMAKEKGFYDDVDLDVNIKEFHHGINITKDVEKGISTFGVGYPNLILEKSHGADIILLNAIFQSSPHILVALANSKIKTIQDFKNKKIMMEDDAITNAPFLSMFFSQKISLEQMQRIKPTFDIYDLINGKVDIFSAYSSNELFTLDSLGIKYNIFDPKEFGFDFYNAFIFTSNSLAKKNPELVGRFQSATLKGWQYAYTHIHETVQVIQKKYNTQKKSYEALRYEAEVMKKLSLKKDITFGDIQVNRLARIKDVYGLMGLIENDFDLNSFIFDDSKIYLSQKEKEFIKNTQLTVSISKDFKPISFQNTDGSPAGIATDYWEILAQELGLKIKYQFDGIFTNQLNSIKNKTADLILSTGKTSDREKYALFTEEYISFPISIATNNKENFIEDFSKVITKKIAVGRNFTAHKLLIKQYPNINFVFVENIKEGLELIQKGKVFGFVDMKPTLVYNIKKLGYDNIKIAGNTGSTFNVSIMIRNDYPLLQSALNKAIHSIEPSTLTEIIKAYENIKFEKSYDYKAFYIIVGLLFSILLFIILKHYFLNQANKKLKLVVDEKTKNLKELNDTLEERIKNAIEENSKKDAILYQQTKNAQMGEMIGNIAHQWRQPLSLISTAASGILAQKAFGTITDKKEDEALNAIIEKVNFLSNTIDTFRDYIKEKKELKEVILQDRLKNDINIVEASLSNNYIVLLKNIDETEPIHINMLVGELSQVIINILNNAKDVLVERKIESPIVKISLQKKQNKAIINIEDNAGGISDEIFPKIFNPYFSTKHQSIGTGLGLYMSKEIIEKHLNGKLYATNTKLGAQFTIELPLEN
ncbi:MAG: ABC transporter substrate-binding protein [Arcobacteraceae bacterium]